MHSIRTVCSRTVSYMATKTRRKKYAKKVMGQILVLDNAITALIYWQVWLKDKAKHSQGLTCIARQQ